MYCFVSINCFWTNIFLLSYRNGTRHYISCLSYTLITCRVVLEFFSSPFDDVSMPFNYFLFFLASGTGVPLSVFCHSYHSCLFFIVFINPWICFFGAFNKSRIEQKKTNAFSLEAFVTDLVKFYRTHLLHPDDWFSLWRLNCRLVSYHSHLTKAKGYKQEVIQLKKLKIVVDFNNYAR